MMSVKLPRVAEDPSCLIEDASPGFKVTKISTLQNFTAFLLVRGLFQAFLNSAGSRFKNLKTC